MPTDPHGAAPGGGAGGRRSGPLSLIADPTFRTLWTIGVLMEAMRWLELVTVGIWTYDLTGSPELVAFATVARMLPMALFGSVTGVIADRLNRKTLMILSLALMATTTAVLAVSLTDGQVLVGAFLSGLGWSTDFPVRRTILGESVGQDRLGPAMSMDSASNNATRMVGPIAGGAVYATVGMVGVYAMASAVYAVTVVLAILVVYRPVARTPRSLAILSEIRQGLAYVRRTRPLIGHLGITIIINLFAFPYAAMVPVIGKETFGADPVRVGLLLTVEGAAAFAGALLIAFFATPGRFWRIYLTGSALFVCSIFVFSLVPVYELALVVLLVGGFGFAGFASMQSAIMFYEAPPEIRSRLMGILSVCIGAGPIGVLHVGWLAGLVGAPMALTIIAAEGLVALAVLVALVPELRR